MRWGSHTPGYPPAEGAADLKAYATAADLLICHGVNWMIERSDDWTIRGVGRMLFDQLLSPKKSPNIQEQYIIKI